MIAGIIPPCQCFLCQSCPTVQIRGSGQISHPTWTTWCIACLSDSKHSSVFQYTTSQRLRAVYWCPPQINTPQNSGKAITQRCYRDWRVTLHSLAIQADLPHQHPSCFRRRRMDVSSLDLISVIKISWRPRLRPQASWKDCRRILIGSQPLIMGSMATFSETTSTAATSNTPSFDTGDLCRFLTPNNHRVMTWAMLPTHVCKKLGHERLQAWKTISPWRPFYQLFLCPPAAQSFILQF